VKEKTHLDSSHHSLHTGTKLLAKMDQNHSTTLFLYNLKIKHVKKFIFGGDMNISLGNMLVFSDMKKTKLFASYCLSKIVILMTLLARLFSICSSVRRSVGPWVTRFFLNREIRVETAYKS